MQSCKHESWVSIAKFLMEEVPVLLSSDKVKDMKDVIYTVFSSLPSNFSDFINWVVEVRRQEDGTQKLSEEEKGRLAVKVLIFFHIHFFRTMAISVLLRMGWLNLGLLFFSFILGVFHCPNGLAFE